MFALEVLCSILRIPKSLTGVDDDEDPPVPIPNTEVKLIRVENTWLETLAQSVEHAAVNRGVVSSSLTGAAKENSRSFDRLFSLLAAVTFQLTILCFGRRAAVNWAESDRRQWREKGG